jgi:hypothetical protein
MIYRRLYEHIQKIIRAYESKEIAEEAYSISSSKKWNKKSKKGEKPVKSKLSGSCQMNLLE